jgi:hypothetical protein
METYSSNKSGKIIETEENKTKKYIIKGKI